MTESFSLDVISPSALPAGNYTIGFNISVDSAPAGVTAAQAAAYVSISPSAIQFTGPGQTQTVTETVSFPAGAVAGSYAYTITTGPVAGDSTSGWPAITGYTIVDPGVYINMTVDPPSSPASPPSIVINSPAPNSTFTYTAGGPALSIPFSFTATTASTDPVITGVDADVSGTQVAVTATGLNSADVTGTGTMEVTAPGIYTLNVRGQNSVNTSQASEDFTVDVTGTPPSVTISSPTNNGVYSFVAGGTGVTVPLSISATSAYGGVQGISATLDGTPISLNIQGLGLATATGTASLSISTAGVHTVAVAVTDALGTTNATSTFTVTALQPAPVVTITQPASGGTPYKLPTGGGSVSVPYAFTATVGYGNIDSIVLALDGQPVSGESFTGVGTPAATGSGSIAVSTSGEHTLSVTATTNGVSTQASATFAVNQSIPPPPAYSLLWLHPVVLNKPFEGGSTIPVAFRITDASGKFVSDHSIVVAVSEDEASPEIFTYGPKGDHAKGTYAITHDAYRFNYHTARGVHTYRIDVYNFWPAGSDNVNLIGPKIITTKAKGCGDHDHGDDHQPEHGSDNHYGRDSGHHG